MIMQILIVKFVLLEIPQIPMPEFWQNTHKKLKKKTLLVLQDLIKIEQWGKLVKNCKYLLKI